MNTTTFKNRFLLLLLAGVVSAATLASTGCNKADGKSQPTASAPASADDSPTPTADKPDDGKVGPMGPTSIDNGGITAIPHDATLAAKGKALFDSKGCGGCHKMDTKLVGPPLAGVTERRKPQWLARWIMHPDKMLQKDPTAEQLLQKYLTPMSNLNVTPDEAKALLAYLATQNKK